MLASNINKVKLSVCVVSYNQERYIADCLKSIVEQKTDFEFEVIVSDDGSTDETRKIIQEFANKYPSIIIPVFQPDNLGALKNYVAVHNMANSKYVCHCDGDDRWLPGKVQAQYDFLESHPDFNAVWTRCNVFNDQGYFAAGKLGESNIFDDGVVTFDSALRFGSVGAHSSLMYRNSARKTREFTSLSLDLFYSWEFLATGKGKLLNESYAEYRLLSEGSLTLTTAIKIRKQVAEIALFFYKKHPEQRKNIFIFALFNFLIDVKAMRCSCFNYLMLCFKTISWVSPKYFINYISDAKRL